MYMILGFGVLALGVVVLKMAFAVSPLFFVVLLTWAIIKIK